MSINGLQTAVLEAGGNIESRCTAPNMQFQNHYVFTKESLERFVVWAQKTMTRFETSSEVYDAGFALPSYSVERDTRTWTYRDRVLTTPVTEPVEKIIFAGNEIDVLPMPKNEAA